jgi:DNA-binding SARP family transcriptional activator
MANGPGLGIRLLGELKLLVRGKPVALPPSRKTRALLGYLVTTGNPQPRERLCDLLWDGPDDPRAALRRSLAKLRPLLDETGARRLVTDRERVAFVPHEAEVDILSMSAGWAGGIASASTSDLEASAARWRSFGHGALKYGGLRVAFRSGRLPVCRLRWPPDGRVRAGT